MREYAKTGLESGAKAEAHCWSTIWNWGFAGAFVAVVDVLSDVYDTFVFSANFQGGRGNNLPSDKANSAARRASFKDKAGAFIKRKRSAIVNRRRYRTAD